MVGVLISGVVYKVERFAWQKAGTALYVIEIVVPHPSVANVQLKTLRHNDIAGRLPLPVWLTAVAEDGARVSTTDAFWQDMRAPGHFVLHAYSLRVECAPPDRVPRCECGSGSNEAGRGHSDWCPLRASGGSR